jgi:5-methylcytosine-specific restriction protein A
MPRAPKVCGEIGCAAIVYEGKRKCPQHYKPFGGKGGTSSRTTTSAHKRRRLRVLGRAGYRCQIQYPDICIGTATDFDHITPLAEGGQDSDHNGQAACRPCHARKSAVEARRAQL